MSSLCSLSWLRRILCITVLSLQIARRGRLRPILHRPLHPAFHKTNPPHSLKIRNKRLPDNPDADFPPIFRTFIQNQAPRGVPLSTRHENTQIAASAPFDPLAVHGRLHRLLPGRISRHGTYPAGETHGRILDDDARLAGISFQTPQPAGQALRVEDRDRQQPGSAERGAGKWRGIRHDDRRCQNGGRDGRQPRRQTPESLVLGLHRKPEHLPQYAGAIPQQTGSRLFHADPPVPQNRREKHVPGSDADTGASDKERGRIFRFGLKVAGEGLEPSIIRVVSQQVVLRVILNSIPTISSISPKRC